VSRMKDSSKKPWQPSRKLIARSAFLMGIMSAVWLIAGILDAFPLELSLPGEGPVRVHAAVTVGCFLVAAWGYWNE
jgi:hypothetical protein